jgi:hypothetical protein
LPPQETIEAIYKHAWFDIRFYEAVGEEEGGGGVDGMFVTLRHVRKKTLIKRYVDTASSYMISKTSASEEVDAEDNGNAKGKDDSFRTRRYKVHFSPLSLPFSLNIS